MKTEDGLRPLYLADDLAKCVGKEVTYVYDDLVFIAHSEVLIQFAEVPSKVLHLFIHTEVEGEAFVSMKAKYEIVAKNLDIELICKGRFTMAPKEGSEEIDLQFFPE